MLGTPTIRICAVTTLGLRAGFVLNEFPGERLMGKSE